MCCLLISFMYMKYSRDTRLDLLLTESHNKWVSTVRKLSVLLLNPHQPALSLTLPSLAIGRYTSSLSNMHFFMGILRRLFICINHPVLWIRLNPIMYVYSRSPCTVSNNHHSHGISDLPNLQQKLDSLRERVKRYY